MGEAAWRNTKLETGAEFDSEGFLVPGLVRLEGAGDPRSLLLGDRRAATPASIPRTSWPNNDQSEIGGALNYYYNRHNLKVQAGLAADRGRRRQLGRRHQEPGVPAPDAVHLLEQGEQLS